MGKIWRNVIDTRLMRWLSSILPKDAPEWTPFDVVCGKVRITGLYRTGTTPLKVRDEDGRHIGTIPGGYRAKDNADAD